MKKKLRFLTLFLLCSGALMAQEVSSLYYMRNNPLRHKLNPAFQPIQGVYVDLPIVPAFYVGAHNNSVAYKHFKDANGLFFWEDGAQNIDKLYDKTRHTLKLKQESRVDLLSFGFRVKEKNFISFGASVRDEVFFNIPRRLADLGLHGAEGEDVEWYKFSKLGTKELVWTEFALGFSREINEKWAAGAKAKFLVGNAGAYAKFDEFAFGANKYGWDARIDGQIMGTIPYATYDIAEDGSLDGMDVNFKHAKAKGFCNGLGVSFDLGATYKPIEHLTLSASLLDLGFIRWRKGGTKLKADGEWAHIYDEDETSENYGTYWEQYGTQINDYVGYKTTEGHKFNTMLSAKVMLGAEYGILDDKITFGLASKTSFFQKTLYEDLTVSANFMPKSWFNFTLSYTSLGGEYSDFGAAMGARLGIFYLYVASDFIPLAYDSDRVPYKNKEANVSFGLMMTFHNGKTKKDSDGDGVWDRKDKCPETPAEAQGTVDETGCPKDTDGDGVPDYLDKCPNTDSSMGEVDETGCPKDTDGDGVADYLDKCPNTSADAQGSVDENGCPKDADGDGIADYLDKCPNTPKEAYSTIDENGCPKDTDGDGVADYLDKCPGTPAEAYGMVDENGCPKDSDGDGIADYLDKCPTVAGVEANSGCPEVKAEVKKLFQQALQGIQFETGKDVIRSSSYAILDNVAKVMEMNPEYNLHIVGHTDNTGDKQKNQILSEKRAAAVKAYLEQKGVSADRITSEGKGQDEPVATNSTAAGRQQNRRVEFTVKFEKVVLE